MKLRGEVAEVHLRIACPPILSPCFYGIDMSPLGELFARQYIGVTDTESDLSEEVRTKMANFLGADSLTYITHKDLAEVTAMPYEDLCMACVTSDYPTDHGKQLIARARENALAGKAGRSYDK
jgi:amidophosphoribosyltransferase